MSYKTNRKTNQAFKIRETSRILAEKYGIPRTGKVGNWESAISVNTGLDEGRRFIIRNANREPLEEVTIEDNLDAGGYEIVGHDFESGDIETVDYAKTLKSAVKKLNKFMRVNPEGQYDSTANYLAFGLKNR